MAIGEIATIVIALMSIATCYVVWKMYLLTRAKSVLLILLAVAWGAAVRILMTFCMSAETGALWILGFWVLLLAGLYYLLRLLQRYIK